MEQPTLKVFAKHQTSNKVAVCCKREDVRDIQIKLEEKLGGKWLLVESLITKRGEVVAFDDGLEYHGFHGRDERYCNAIEDINK